MKERNYQLQVYNPQGVYLSTIQSFSYLRYTRVVNDIGTATIHLSVSELGDTLIEFNTIFVIIRDGSIAEDTAWFVKKIIRDYVNETLIIECEDANHLLSTRIIAYAAGSSEASKTNYINKIMLEIMEENFTTGTRDIPTLTIPSSSAAPNIGTQISKSFSRNNVLSTLRTLSDISLLDVPLYFDVRLAEASKADTYIFRVYRNQIGKNRTVYPIFGLRYNNLEELVEEKDYTNLTTNIYIGGQDTGSNRLVVERESNFRARSIFLRNEAFKSALSLNTIASLNSEGDSELEKRKPLLKISAKIRDTDTSRYQIDWDFGDKITIETDTKYSGNIEAVQIRVDRDSEDINAYVVYEGAL